MDSIDAKIVELLQENARITVSQIGRLINMTQPAVGERIRKLEEKGIIQAYKVILDPEKLGKHVTAFILIQAENCRKMIDFCEQSSEVVEAHQLSGQFNFLIKVMTHSMRTLEEFIYTCSQYGHTTTMTVISTPIQSKSFMLSD